MPSLRDRMHYPAMHVGQPVLPPLVAERQLRVVDAEEVQQRGLVIVDVNRVLDNVPAELIGRPVDVAALHAAAGHPEAERPAEVIAAGWLFRWALPEGRAAKLAAPDD